MLVIPSWAPVTDPFLSPPADGLSLISAAAAAAAALTSSRSPLGSSLADDIAHDTKKGSIAKAQERINSKGNIQAVGTGTGIPKILIIFNNEHRFGQQSGLDECSGRNPTIFLDGIAFHVYFVLSKIDTNTTL